MKIVADKNIPFLKGIAEQYGDVTYLAGSEFSKETVADADTLIVRTVTHFGKEILDNSNVKLICSATIGFDHIDTEYCKQNNIVWKNAPGCNSGSVMQYIVSALILISRQKGFNLKEKTIGIVGVGNVGKKVAKACQLLGMRVLLNDPPRQAAEKSDIFVDLDTIKREADIITFHTPLTKNGETKTFHLADNTFFELLKKDAIIINSARGGIIDTQAIKKALKEKKISGAIIDCWENELDIDTEYMNLVDIATPHIAGYSADGKANATRMSLESIADFWNLSKNPIDKITIPQIENRQINMENIIIGDALLRTYNPTDDNNRFRANPELFSSLRGNYPLRREYQAYSIINANNEQETLLKDLGFGIIKQNEYE